MNRLQEYNKGIVALVMAILMVAEDWFGLNIAGVDEQWVITLLALLAPVLVVVTPNR